MNKITAWFTRYLDPQDILLEVIFGLLIVMTFTMAFRVIDGNVASTDVISNQVNRMLIAAIGCTIAWGMIDAVITVLTNVAERARSARIIANISNSTTENHAIQIVADVLDDEVAIVSSESARRAFYRDIIAHARKMTVKEQGIKRDDVYSAIVVILSAMLATLPALIPYLFIDDANLAIRLSNVIAVAMLFGVGYTWAKHAGGKPFRVGLLVSIVGVVIILIAIPLGG
jgi:VIT1/CCC1 family predicted Fe2+/Mn2+ transporter